MNTENSEQLQLFIARNNIGRVNDMLIFKGIIHFIRNGSMHTIHSDVQVIMLPQNTALYILEFLNEGYGQNEMFNTAEHRFKCIGNKTLHISNDTAAVKISIPSSPEIRNS